MRSPWFAVLTCWLSSHAEALRSTTASYEFWSRVWRPADNATCCGRQGLFSGVGLGLGGVVGGVIYSRLGAPAVFACAAAVLATGWCACMAVQALASCVHGREHRT